MKVYILGQHEKITYDKSCPCFSPYYAFGIAFSGPTEAGAIFSVNQEGQLFDLTSTLQRFSVN